MWKHWHMVKVFIPMAFVINHCPLNMYFHHIMSFTVWAVNLLKLFYTVMQASVKSIVMKKILIPLIIIASFFIFNTNQSDKTIDLALMNIEALAYSEGSLLGECYKSVNSSGGYPSNYVTYCGGISGCTRLYAYSYSNKSVCL